MAYEIGHLLLGPEALSSRPAWSNQDLKQAQKGKLNFTPAEAEKMKIQITRRIKLATTAK